MNDMPPTDRNHLKEIIITLADSGVDFIICGGVALALHGVERMTMDIDIALDMREGNIQKFLDAMKSLELVPRAPVSADSLLDPEKRRLMIEEKNALVFTFIDTRIPFRQVDIFLGEEAFNSMEDDVEMIEIDRHKIRVVSKKRLLQMKKEISPQRDKDVYDINALEKLIKNS